MFSNNKTPIVKPTAATLRDVLNLVFSTTHPPRKERVYVSYHDDGAHVQR